ncbi:(Lyso)-N-acylphosphatidylethanolamine lipase-like isoform X2 [Megalops cyprinoides]|uniref:(Lyso)-N-acylphosphatidylethanolamine lipase-like isoform X2 n=1 Tax=Megalops cyprinoides TaxID=118141 RepID=UPI001864820D|nr:(Lyso)-N-acylphosphatidylethanolamine lipase-like isoform X2 [Megalops cyprinoides]
MIQDYSQTEPESGGGWWLSWTPTSPSLLKSTEARILACVKNDLFARFVTLPNQDEIWTITVTNKHLSTLAQTAPQTPLVLVHGFGGGVGLWIRNLDPLCRSRPVIAFDLLGFGRSARPPFPSDPAQAEEQLVSSIEQWRQVLGLERMILLGHSLGGYLATSYTIQYPERVSHLILADPWGFPEIDQPGSEGSGGEGSQVKRLPGWVKAVASVASFFNPLAVIRAAGPWGPSLLNRIRPDFKRKFEDLFEDDTMTEYIYHCNAQTPRVSGLGEEADAAEGTPAAPLSPRHPAVRGPLLGGQLHGGPGGAAQTPQLHPHPGHRRCFTPCIRRPA